jgi:hypothetical protein
MRFMVLLLLLALAFQYSSANEIGSIFGIIIDRETGVPIAYANVNVEGTTLSALSEDDGSYTITGIPAGEYTVRAMMFGYVTEKRYRITVENGSSFEVNFTLEQTPPGIQRIR